MIYIDTKSTDVYYNFGCELYFATEKNLGDESFLMWRTTPTLMIGKFQNTLEEIDSSYAKSSGISIVRRMSGGGTIYTDLGGWQFSFITRSLGMEIEFTRFVEPVVNALSSLGVNAELTGRNDITVDGKKVSGNAQYKVGGTTVHHGSLLYSTDISQLVRATTPKEYKITSKAIKSVRDRVTNISEHMEGNMSPEEFRDYVVNRVMDSVYEITPEDDKRIRALALEHFDNDEIIYGKTPKFDIEKTMHLKGGTITVGLTVQKGIIAEAGVTGDFFAGDLNLAEIITGQKYNPEAIYNALKPHESKLFMISARELTDAIFD